MHSSSGGVRRNNPQSCLDRCSARKVLTAESSHWTGGNRCQSQIELLLVGTDGDAEAHLIAASATSDCLRV